MISRLPARTASASAERPRSAPAWLAPVVLGAAVLLAYAGSLRVPFLFDDTGAVLNNPTIRHLSLAALSPPADGSTTTGRPLVNLSLALNYAVSGENVWSYHALNLALHLGAALVLLGLLRRTLRAPALRNLTGDAADVAAFFAALLWAVHPLQTETVVCIAQRTESLCTFFYLLTFYAFARGVTAPPRAAQLWLAASVFACLFGMASKEVMVTAPLLVLLYDRTFLAGTFAEAWRRRRGYYFALAATWLLLAALVLRGGGSRGAAAGFGLGVTPWTYLLKQCEALVRYAGLCFWPHPLVLDYGTGVVHSLGAVWWQAMLILASLAATLWALRRRPVAGFAAAAFFILLAPSSSVVPLVTQTMAEHRMYLPLAFVLVAFVLAVRRWLGPRGGWLLGVVAAACAGATIDRIRDYRTATHIWADTIAKEPFNARAHNNLAWTLQHEGNVAAANEEFARAVALQPDYVTARYNWGVALLDQGRADDAIAQFEAAVRLAPDHADALLNLGNALMQVHRVTEAIARYEQALRLKPAADAHFDLGIALLEAERPAEAAAHFRAALQMNPNLPEAHFRLGRIADQMGEPAEAETEYRRALALDDAHAAAHAKLGLILARAGRLPDAAEQLAAAVRLRPDDADAQANLGNVFLLEERPREAVPHYEAAARLRPDDPQLRANLRMAREAAR